MNSFSWPEKPNTTAFPIARPGLPYIITSGLITFMMAITGFHFLFVIGLVLTLFICFFFRDPDRVIQDVEGAVSSPADGRVIVTEDLRENPYFEGPCRKISIFMSVFNVHVNRVPATGKIVDVKYYPGSFINAAHDKATTENERNALVFETADGKKYATVQVAGLIARRIICGVQSGQTLNRGSRYGMICFGSRLDIFLPPESDVAVRIGDTVQAGTSIIGYMKNNG
jgi:phosphatidylserine decarboxylase